MSINHHTPCDDDGFVCPYDAQSVDDCERWCGVILEPDFDDIYFNYDTVYVE